MPQDVQSNLSEPLTRMIKNSNTHLFRIIHYPPLRGSEGDGAVRAAAHEDINLITLLPTSTAPGLQVKDREGTWYDVACDPGAIIINTGEMLQTASRGYYEATTHRVVNPTGSQANTSRYSMPFFLHPRRDVYLTPEMTAQQSLDKRLAELGLK